MATNDVTKTRPIKHIDPCPKLNEIYAWVNGNGTPGAKVRLALLETDIKEIKEMLIWIRNVMMGLFITTAASLITFFLFQVIPHVGG